MLAAGLVFVLLSAWSVFQLAGAVDPRAAAVLGTLGSWWFGAPWPLHLGGSVAFGLGAAVALRRSGWARDLVAPTQAPARHWTLGFGVLLVGILVHVAQLQADEWVNLASRRTDFGMFVEASRAWRAGEDAYRAVDGGYFYPPVFAVLITPLTLLPMGVASTVWLVAKLILIVDAVRRLREAFAHALPTPGARQLFGFVVLAVTARFWLADLAYGNTNVLMTWLGIVALTSLRARPARAGIALAAGTLIKVVPAVLAVPAVVLDRRRTLVVASATVLVASLLPLLNGVGHGIDTWNAYVEWGVRAKLGASLGQVDNQSIRGACERWLDQAPVVARALWALLSSAVVVGAAVVTWRVRGSRAEMFALALWPGVLLAVSPGSWVVHFVGGMLPAAALTARLIATGWRDRRLVAVFVLLNLAWTISGWFPFSVKWSTHQSWFLIGLLVLLTAVAREAWRQADVGVPAAGRAREPRARH